MFYEHTKVTIIHAIDGMADFDDDWLFALVETPNWNDAGETYYHLNSLEDERPSAIGHYFGNPSPEELDSYIRQWIADDQFYLDPHVFRLPGACKDKRDDEWKRFYDNLEVRYLS